jgi:DNA-binding response OmpR family regulator
VIEDDPHIADLLQCALEDEGYEVLIAIDDQALYLARERCPAVVLLDLMLPGMDGREISRKLRADPATKHIPIILMSASSEVRVAAKQLAVNDYLTKPFLLDRLYATVAWWALAGAGTPREAPTL